MRRLALLAALLALTGCGGKEPSSHRAREAVSLYISRVNAIEFLLRKQILAVSRATAAYGHNESPPKVAARLGRAEATFAKLHRDIARLKPPPQALRLHRSMLALVAAESRLAGELRDLSRFNPAFASALRPLVVANTKTQTLLKGAKQPSLAAAAVHAYRGEVTAAATRLRRLNPPQVERALFDGQLQRLVALEAALGQLERALKARDGVGVAKAEHAVALAAVISDARVRQVAQRDAVLVYNARVHAVQRLARSVQRERDRLQRTLP
jgi:hypothetical protein